MGMKDPCRIKVMGILLKQQSEKYLHLSRTPTEKIFKTSNRVIQTKESNMLQNSAIWMTKTISIDRVLENPF